MEGGRAGGSGLGRGCRGGGGGGRAVGGGGGGGPGVPGVFGGGGGVAAGDGPLGGARGRPPRRPPRRSRPAPPAFPCREDRRCTRRSVPRRRRATARCDETTWAQVYKLSTFSRRLARRLDRGTDR